MRKKDIAAKLAANFFPIGIYSKIKSIIKNELIVLAYHRVVDTPIEKFFYDFELVSCDSKTFKQQMEYIKRHYHPISLYELKTHIENGSSLPKNSIMITFDDGFDDNYHNAFPILKSLNIPATIFISTGYIDTTESIWFDKLAHQFLHIPEQTIEISQINYKEDLSANIDLRKKQYIKFVETIKKLTNEQRLNVIKIFESQINFNIHSKKQSRMLSWTQVAEMEKNGITFGSHSVSHPILNQLELDKLKYELQQSKIDIEKCIGKSIDSIAYPNGNADCFDETVIESSKQSGYTIGFSYISGVNALPIKNNFSIERLHVDYYMSMDVFKSQIAFPSIFKD